MADSSKDTTNLNWEMQWTNNENDNNDASLQPDWLLTWDGANAEHADIEFGTEIRPIISTVMDYELSVNKPQINGVELSGNKSNEDINICSISNLELEELINGFI